MLALLPPHDPSMSASDSQQLPPTGATCRTCKGCRQKKIKCNGQRPKCQACVRRDQACEYPNDNRRAVVRGKKADIRQLRQELEELKRQHQPQHSRHSSTAVYSDHEDTSPRVGPGFEWSEPCEAASTPECRLEARLSSATPHATTSTPQPYRKYHSSGPYQEPHGHVGIPSPESSAGDRETRVYGATSLLHNESSAVALSGTPSNREAHDFEKAAQHELISNAALGRQKELTIYSAPSVSASVDFDGVAPDLAMYLLELHWNRQHLSYLVTYRPAIMDSLITGGPYVNKLLLNAIFFSTSLYSDRASLRLVPEDPSTTGNVFYNRFKTLLADHIETPTIPTIVALLLCGSSLVPYGEQSAGWLFCGMAYRMITDLGCHLDVSTLSLQNDAIGGLSTTDKEIRKRVYWGAYVCDTFQSLFLGRRPTLYKSEGTISCDFLDTYEEMEEWKPCVDVQTQPPATTALTYQAQPCYATSTLGCLHQLCAIANRIIESFYATSRPSLSQHASLLIRDELRSLLEDWKQRLPPNLRFEPGVDRTPPPHQITPHTTHRALVILTEQPFLRQGHFDFTPGPQCKAESKERCIEAALAVWKLVQAYRDAFTLRRAQYSISYATYCAVLAILQYAPQNREDYSPCIQFFWVALLEYQQGCSKALKRPLDLLRSLMRRVESLNQGVDTVDGLNVPLPSNPSATMALSQTAEAAHEDPAIHENWDAITGLSTFGLENGNSLDWLTSVSDDLSFTDDTAFGIFM